jgi:hypothetical protein
VKRIIVLHYTGSEATSLKIATRISRKMLGAQFQGICVLVDFEDVLEISPQFLTVLVSSGLAGKARFCGLPILQQRFVRSLQQKGT